MDRTIIVITSHTTTNGQRLYWLETRDASGTLLAHGDQYYRRKHDAARARREIRGNRRDVVLPSDVHHVSALRQLSVVSAAALTV